MNNSVRIIVTFLSMLLLGSISAVIGQDAVGGKRATYSSLINTFHWKGGDEANAQLDNLVINVGNNPKSHGLIILYCGKRCIYGEPEAHVDGIRQAMKFRKYDPNLISVVFGGFREEMTTEMWLVPDQACPPSISPTLGTDKITFVRSRKKVFRPYWL